MSVVPYSPVNGTQLEGRHRWVTLLPEVASLAHAISNTNFVPKGMRGDEAAICAAILYGDEIGLSPMQALAHIAVIEGKPSLAAETQRALILAAGHDIWFEEQTITRVVVCGRRHGSENVQRVTWTMDDAKRAGIGGKQNWRTYPRQMLTARASAELARAVFADVIGGLAATEELLEGEIVPPPDAPAPTAPAAAPTSRRKRAGRVAPPAAPVIPPPVEGPEPPPLPDDPDEPSEPSAPKASQAQIKKMMALFNEHGMSDRDDRLDWTNKQLDRTVISASELTDVEASTIITALSESLPDDTPEPADTRSEELVGHDHLEIIEWLRDQAQVDDEWVRNVLEEMGVQKLPAKQISKNALKKLTKTQAMNLRIALHQAIDERRMNTEA